MLEVMQGNLFDAKVQTLVNPICVQNAIGISSALLFKDKFPALLKDYLQKCKDNLIIAGEPYLWQTEFKTAQKILNLPVKVRWQDPTSIDLINSCLKRFSEKYQEWGITSIAFPALGLDTGLYFSKIKKLMIAQLSTVVIPVFIVEPKVN